MRQIVFTGENVELGGAAYDEAKEVAKRVLRTLMLQGRKGSLAWADDYNDYSARGHFTITEHG